MNTVIVRRADKNISLLGKRRGVSVVVQDGWDMPEGHALFVANGTGIPWDVIEAGFYYLEKWDAAAPLWRYNVTAAEIGTPSERERTEKVVLDLRIPLFAHELLFIANTELGREFLATWLAECEGKAEPRLAFLRALHLVKPRFCALPQSWLLEERQRALQDSKVLRGGKDFWLSIQQGIPILSEVNQRHRPAGGLTRVEIGPGRYVLCHPSDMEAVRERFALLNVDRAARRELTHVRH